MGVGRGATHLGLDVERDEAVGDQVVDGLEPLFSNKVLPVVVETEVSRLVPEPGRNGGGHFGFRPCRGEMRIT